MQYPLIGEHQEQLNNAIQPRIQQPGYQRMREMTLDDLLLENRIVFMIGEINYRMATEVIMKLLYLDNLKRGVEISLYINSPGGSVDDTMAIYDTIRFIGSPVATYCIGRAQSGAAIILAAGTKGRRHALPHAKVMLHQPWGGVTGQAEDIRIQAEEILRLLLLDEGELGVEFKKPKREHAGHHEPAQLGHEAHWSLFAQRIDDADNVPRENVKHGRQLRPDDDAGIKGRVLLPG